MPPNAQLQRAPWRSAASRGFSDVRLSQKISEIGKKYTQHKTDGAYNDGSIAKDFNALSRPLRRKNAYEKTRAESTFKPFCSAPSDYPKPEHHIECIDNDPRYQRHLSLIFLYT